MTLTDDPGATYKLLAAALQGMGYQFETFHENERLMARYTAPSGKSWTTSAAFIHYPFSKPDTYWFCVDKSAAYEYAAEKHMPVPATLTIGIADTPNASVLEQMLVEHQPLVVKPNDSSLSKGLTLNISTRQALGAAITKARAVRQSDVLIQQQVSGEEVRFVVIRGRVVAALLRQTPRIIGDGTSTVAELLRRENQIRQGLSFEYLKYPQLDESIIDPAFFSRTDVLGRGEVLELSRATMIKNGCSVFEIIDEIHPSYIEDIERLVENLDTDFLVADVLIKDHTVPASNTNHWFLEFNNAPVLKLCYSCRDGHQFDIVPLVARLIDDTLHSA